jgi:uncharacterized protein (TIGR02453 family)
VAASFITPELFAFLRALAKNNERPWFEKNKQRYIDVVRDPLCGFVEAIGPKLRSLSPAVVADPRPSGGSLFRIYRDTRFSKDKRPYKTRAALAFRMGPKGSNAPSFYLQLAPAEVFVGIGVWHPPSEHLQAIRVAIDENPAAWKRATRMGLRGEPALKRVPRGFDKDHPLAVDLRHKSFSVSTGLTEKQACAPDFNARFVRVCKSAMPLARFLGDALGLEV